MLRDESPGAQKRDDWPSRAPTALDRWDLRPDDGRDDWEPVRAEIEAISDTLRSGLERAAGASRNERAELAALVGPTAALLFASGDRAGAAALLLAADPVAPDPGTRQLWTTANGYLAAFVDLERARYHQRRGESSMAARLAAPLCDHPAPALASAARAIERPGQRGAHARGGQGRFYRERGFWLAAMATVGVTAAYSLITYLGGPDRKVRREIAAMHGGTGSPSISERDARIEQIAGLIDREAERGVVSAARSRPAPSR